MKIAIAQMNSPAGDFAATVERMLAYGEAARAQSADLLVFPAPTLMGVDPGALLQDPGFMADMSEAMTKLEQGLELPALVPFAFDAGGVAASDVALVRNGHAMPLTLASHLSSRDGSALLSGFLNYLSGGEEEGAKLAPGGYADSLLEGDASLPSLRSLPPRVSIGGVDVGVALVYDDFEHFRNGDVAADVICYLPVIGYDTDDEASCLAPSVSDGCYLEDASEANAWLVVAGGVGAYERNVFCGGSFVMAPWGELALAAPSFEEGLFCCDIDVVSEGPLAEAAVPSPYDRTRVLWEACVLAVRDHVEKRGYKGAAVKLDGSLGSAVVAALACDALGPLRVRALACAGDAQAQADAVECARRLRIPDVAELGPGSLAAAASALGVEGDACLIRGLAEARLGALALAESLLALSPLDKTSLALGEGAGEPEAACRAGGFAPLGDIYRSDVARLARYRNAVSPVIAAGALSRMGVPLGVGVDELASRPELALSKIDAALLLHFERGQGLSELADNCESLALSEDALDNLLVRVRAAEGWRRGAPYYPAFSACSLDETPEPVAYGWRDRVREFADGPTPEQLNDALGKVLEMVTGMMGHEDDDEASEGNGASASAAERISEMLGYLQDLSGERQLRSDGGAPSSGMWPEGMFSDN